MKQFDLEAAKKGAMVCTRDGREARILCFDLKDDKYPIRAALYDLDDTERVYGYDELGVFWDDGYEPGQRDFDLIMADDDYMEKLEKGEYGKPDHIGKATDMVDWDYWLRMYAGMAMQGLMTDWKHHFDGFHIAKAVQSISKLSVQAADALIDELKKEKK